MKSTHPSHHDHEADAQRAAGVIPHDRHDPREHPHETQADGRTDAHNSRVAFAPSMAHVDHEQAHEDLAGAAVHRGHAGHDDAHVDHTGHEMVFRNRFWLCLALTIPVLLYSHMIQMWVGFTMPQFPGSEWVAPGFSIVIFVVGGVPFLRMAVPEVRNRQPGMMLLISLAISVAFVYSLVMVFVDPASGFFWEMALLIDVMLLGHWLEMRSVRQASGALDGLARLLPDTADRLDEAGRVTTVPVSDLRSGDLVLVRPGAGIPADGTVEQGDSDVNESMITGESKPVARLAGDKVIAGTINGDGSLRVRVLATGEQTALAGIMRLVREAQQSRSSTQVLADRAAGWLFYIALGMAALTAIVWTVATGFNWQVVERTVTVLVIACPHALGLAVPLVVAITTTMAATNGILIRNRLAMEDARLLDTVVFDKTGTLTTGEQGLVDLAVIDEWGADDALALAAASEGDSEHAIARAVRRAAESRNLALPRVDAFEAIKGRGIKVLHEGRQIYVGGPRLLELLAIAPPPRLAAFADSAGSRGQTVIFLAIANAVVAAFAIADTIRPESAVAVRLLHKMGKEVVMLTGDSNAVANAVADALGIDRVFAQVLPEHKDAKIRQLQQEGRTVAMVGDGVNDAPALARADVGIAIGGGTDVAIESAGIILVRNNPLDVANVIDLSYATYRKMVQNLWWAAGYNIVALPLAAGILAPFGIALSPAVGAALMAISTLVVAINAQTLRRHAMTKV